MLGAKIRTGPIGGFSRLAENAEEAVLDHLVTRQIRTSESTHGLVLLGLGSAPDTSPQPCPAGAFIRRSERTCTRERVGSVFDTGDLV